MTGVLSEFGRIVSLLVWAALMFAVTMAAAVVVERAIFGLRQARSHYLTRRYGPLVRRALEGDEAARRGLAASPARHRVAIAWLLIAPLIETSDPRRIAEARATAQAMDIFPLAERYLRSRLWWRRALALRMFGLVQARDYAAQIVAGLDDSHQDVRAAALDGLADLHNPATVPALVVRLHDESLPRGRRGAALKAFGSACEPFLLELSELDFAHRRNCAIALAVCGTPLSRPVLCRWTRDPRVDVRAAAFLALAHVGLDEDAARAAVEGLDNSDPSVRVMAAHALRGWQSSGAVAHLTTHLDDTWVVAVQSARTLRSMGYAGDVALRAQASRSDLAGSLVRQVLWRPDA